MSTQYNAIQAPYDLIRLKSIALLERDNIRTTILPHIHNARILDLACGSGFYTYPFLDWGAASVVGVDISEGMLAQARRSCPVGVELLDSSAAAAAAPDDERNNNNNNNKKTVTFINADISRHPPQLFAGGQFDIVFGAWLLNYAATPAALTSFYRTVAHNLRRGGVFISITLPPHANPRESIDEELRLRPREKGGSGGLVYEALRDVEEGKEEGKGKGVLFRVRGCETGEAGGVVEFECWYLEKRWYEECAREAGLRGGLRWGKTDARAWLERGEWEGGASREEMESYEVYPNYGILVIGKS